MPRRIIQLQHVALYDAYLLLFLIDISCEAAAVHYSTPSYARGLVVPIIRQQSPNTLTVVRHPELIALYASDPNHVLGQ